MSAKKAAKKTAAKAGKKETAGAGVAVAARPAPVGTVLIHRKALRPWAGQPRKVFDKQKLRELADSLRSNGQLQALIVRPLPKAEGGVTHEIVVGERRWRASEPAGLQELECRESALDDKAAIELSVMENTHRDDLTVMEEALGYQAMVGLGWTVKEIATRTGRSEAVLYELLDLCGLDETVQQELLDGTITRTTARVLGRIEDPERRKAALVRVVKPTYEDRPLAQGKAVELLQREFLDPQKRAQAWAKQEEKLMRDFPGATIVPLAKTGDYTGWDSAWIPAADQPRSHELAVHVRQEEVPTWGKLGEKHGAAVAIIPDSQGKPVVMVNKEAVKAGELAAGEKDPTNCIFPISGGKGRHDQSLVNQRASEERQARIEKLGEWHKGLRGELRTWLLEPERGATAESLQAAMPGLLGWVFDQTYLLDDLEAELPDFGIDLEAMGEGEDEYDRKSDGARKWLQKVLEGGWSQGLAYALFIIALGRQHTGSDGYLAEMAPVAKAMGYPLPEGMPVEVANEEEPADEEDEAPESGEGERPTKLAYLFADFGFIEGLDTDLAGFIALPADERGEWLSRYFGGVMDDVPGHFVEFAKKHGEEMGLTPEMEAVIGQALQEHLRGRRDDADEGE